MIEIPQDSFRYIFEMCAALSNGKSCSREILSAAKT